MTSYIVELTTIDVSVIAQMLHMRYLNDPVDQVEHAIEALRTQAVHVSHDPKRHFVYAKDLEAPSGAVRFEGSMFIPI